MREKSLERHACAVAGWGQRGWCGCWVVGLINQGAGAGWSYGAVGRLSTPYVVSVAKRVSYGATVLSVAFGAVIPAESRVWAQTLHGLHCCRAFCFLKHCAHVPSVSAPPARIRAMPAPVPAVSGHHHTHTLAPVRCQRPTLEGDACLCAATALTRGPMPSRCKLPTVAGTFNHTTTLNVPWLPADG